MKVTVEELSPTKRALVVELPTERVTSQMEAKLREWERTLALPGFRKGRVPRAIIQRRFDNELREEVLRDLIPDSMREAVEQTALAPVSQPTVEDVHFHAGEPLTYRAVVDIKPTVTVAEYRGIALEREKIEVGDAEVDRAVEFLREDAAEYAPMEGWPALKDDLVLLDSEATVNGRPFKGSSGKNLTVVLGREGYLPGFSEQLLGLKKGDVKQFTLEVPTDAPRKELAGKQVAFHVKVNEVKKRRVPELNDEFAKTVGDVDTVAALKDKLREQLTQRKDREQDATLRRKLLDQLRQRHTVALPDSLVDRETAAVLDELLMTLRASGGQIEGLPTDPEALRAQARDTAVRRLTDSLILEGVAKQEQITVTDEEVEAEIARLASLTRQEPGAVRKALTDPVRRAGLMAQIVERKSLDFLMAQATITDAYHLIQPA